MSSKAIASSVSKVIVSLSIISIIIFGIFFAINYNKGTPGVLPAGVKDAVQDVLNDIKTGEGSQLDGVVDSNS